MKPVTLYRIIKETIMVGDYTDTLQLHQLDHKWFKDSKGTDLFVLDQKSEVITLPIREICYSDKNKPSEFISIDNDLLVKMQVLLGAEYPEYEKRLEKYRQKVTHLEMSIHQANKVSLSHMRLWHSADKRLEDFKSLCWYKRIWKALFKQL
jgi:hypothetical protein